MVVMPAKSQSRLPDEHHVDKKITEEPIEWIFSQDTVPAPSSGGYLTRPSNIYDEEPSESKPLSEEASFEGPYDLYCVCKKSGKG